ncbi:hypothetical protein QBC44DRAFT_315270, partial [Cladorrhinum sp. PSN332]
MDDKFNVAGKPKLGDKEADATLSSKTDALVESNSPFVSNDDRGMFDGQSLRGKKEVPAAAAVQEQVRIRGGDGIRDEHGIQGDTTIEEREDENASQMVDMPSCFPDNLHPDMRKLAKRKWKTPHSMIDDLERELQLRPSKPTLLPTMPKPFATTMVIDAAPPPIPPSRYSFELQPNMQAPDAPELPPRSPTKSSSSGFGSKKARRKGIDHYFPPEFGQRSSSYGHVGGRGPLASLFGSGSAAGGQLGGGGGGGGFCQQRQPKVGKFVLSVEKNEEDDGGVNSSEKQQEQQQQQQGHHQDELKEKGRNSTDWTTVGSDGSGNGSGGSGGSGESGGGSGVDRCEAKPEPESEEAELLESKLKKVFSAVNHGGATSTTTRGVMKLAAASNWKFQHTVKRMAQNFWKMNLLGSGGGGGNSKRAGKERRHVTVNNWDLWGDDELYRRRRIEMMEEGDDDNDEGPLTREQVMILQCYRFGEPGPSRPKVLDKEEDEEETVVTEVQEVSSQEHEECLRYEHGKAQKVVDEWWMNRSGKN